jgi:hypothetical protein
MQSGPGFSDIPGAELAPAAAMPDPDEEQIALADVDILRRLSGGKLVTTSVVEM